ncbi:MAG: AbrB/MazE/SpoVT family DNA-binding domain-containing protein [Actinopolymorphaceae bacterium]
MPEIKTTRAVVRAKGQVTIPQQIRKALHVGEGDDVAFTVEPDGRVLLVGMKSIPADQAWFWTEEWQAGEREASEQVARGEGTKYEDVEDFLDALD